MTDNHDADDETVDTNDTGKDHRDNALHHKLGLHHTHAGDTHRALGGTVRRAEHGEHDGGGDAHGPEEGCVGGAELSDLSSEEEGKEEHFSLSYLLFVCLLLLWCLA